MKLGNDVLVEIVEIVRDGIANGTDVSQALRDLDLDGLMNEDADVLTLSVKYKQSKGRVA